MRPASVMSSAARPFAAAKSRIVRSRSITMPMVLRPRTWRPAIDCVMLLNASTTSTPAILDCARAISMSLMICLESSPWIMAREAACMASLTFRIWPDARCISRTSRSPDCPAAVAIRAKASSWTLASSPSFAVSTISARVVAATRAPMLASETPTPSSTTRLKRSANLLLACSAPWNPRVHSVRSARSFATRSPTWTATLPPLPVLAYLRVQELGRALLAHELRHKVHDPGWPLHHAGGGHQVRDRPRPFPEPPFIPALLAARHHGQLGWRHTCEFPRPEIEHLVRQRFGLLVPDRQL